MNDFDVIIIGGGHAGVEAALAVARMSQTAAIVTLDKAQLALMSCNPAIGGVGKSQIVKEIDALGGIMGIAADETGIQYRQLNLSRGPAVWSTRIQSDRIAYNRYVTDFVNSQSNVEIIEDEVTEILQNNGKVVGINTSQSGKIYSQAVIVASGTFLSGVIHIGDSESKGGRMFDRAAGELSRSLIETGFEVGRLKTGTPPRLDGSTIDFDLCEIQEGQEPIPLMSYRSKPRNCKQTNCFLTRTTEATRAIVLTNKDRSPIFSGRIKSVGPRYCPSIEDKYVRFADKPTHQIFLEPEGNGTNEIYPNGFSTALPEDVQLDAMRTIVGLENVKITRPGYAVEYDYCPAHQIEPTLETKRLAGLFFVGQINGTSGYEEAAGQGLLAGVNAVLLIRDEKQLVLARSEAYLGVMVDDLVTRSTTEPYRMFTSRAEYRLSLREDNARDRMFQHAKRLGLIPDDESEAFDNLKKETTKLIRELERVRLPIAEVGSLGERFQRAESVSLAELLRQPNIRLVDIEPLLRGFDQFTEADSEAMNRASIVIRYQGYIDKQAREVSRYLAQEKQEIPRDFPFEKIGNLRNEAREKFVRFQPLSLGQAGRIEGVTPGDIAVLSIHLKKHNHTGASSV